MRTGAPSHVPWTGGVVGATVDLTTRWTTGVEGMRSSRGDELTNWRAWESAETNAARFKQRRKGQIN